MSLGAIDWVLPAAYLAFNVGAALWLRRRSGEGLAEFFASGRSAPWWLAGTSMAATTFAPDTPLGLTGLVAESGVSGYWWNWSFALSTAATVALFARYWRRSAALTDLELTEIRYSGRPAAFLRGFRALYLSIPINCLVMGWVNLAMLKILSMAFGIEDREAVLILAALLALTVFVAGLGGLRGVFITDLAQFTIMMGLSITLAVLAVEHIGGIAELKSRLIAMDGGDERLRMLPDPSSERFPFAAFLIYVGINWWASWKPSSGSDGGGYIAQRLLSSRDEGQARGASLWFGVAQYVVRPWPWMLVALVSLVIYPNLSDPENGYVLVMNDVMPPSLAGLMLAGFAASYMSTISTHLNWGASYLVHDGYRRYVSPDASAEKLIRVSRWTTVALAALSLGAAASLGSISAAWKILVATGAGVGTVLIARWFWWRVNAWSEIAAMTAAAVISVGLQVGGGLDTGDPNDFVTLMMVTTPLTVLVWAAVALLTPPESEATLTDFYRRIRPHPTFWGPVARRAPEVVDGSSWGADFVTWACVCGLIYGALFGIGKVLLLDPAVGALGLLISFACGARLTKVFADRPR